MCGLFGQSRVPKCDAASGVLGVADNDRLARATERPHEYRGMMGRDGVN